MLVMSRPFGSKHDFHLRETDATIVKSIQKLRVTRDDLTREDQFFSTLSARKSTHETKNMRVIGISMNLSSQVTANHKTYNYHKLKTNHPQKPLWEPPPGLDVPVDMGLARTLC